MLNTRMEFHLTKAICRHGLYQWKLKIAATSGKTEQNTCSIEFC